MTETDPFAGVVPELRKALEERGFVGLTPVQHAVLAGDQEGRNLRISSQTGSGKTVAIGMVLGADLLGALDSSAGKDVRGPLALIITPTRELAAQVRDELAWLFSHLPRINVGVVTGGSDLMRERRFLKRNPALLVATPGRLLDHMRAGAVDLSGVRHVVLDEADQMLDMGFREELEAIVDALPEHRRSHLVSATFARQVRSFADRFQADALHIEGTRLGAANTDIEHTVHLVLREEVYAALVNVLLSLEGARCLIFVRRRIDAAELAELLAADGFSALPFSGDLPQGQRNRTLNAFRNGIVGTLVATDIAARGIDVADIAAVVHIHPPMDAETYVHRSGRTGRAGNKGRSVMLLPPQAERPMRRMLGNARIEADWLPAPGARAIAKALVKSSRRRLHEALRNEEPPDAKQLAYAEKLLSEHEPAVLVTRLLELATPTPPREPMPVRALEPRGHEPARVSRGYVRYEINWGLDRGATANRLIAHVCRRGKVSSRKIGAVDLGSRSSTFELVANEANKFDAAIEKPDERDPHLHIRRVRDDGRERQNTRPGPPKRRGKFPHGRHKGTGRRSRN